MTIETGVLFTFFSLILGVLGYQLSRTNQEIKKQQLKKQEVREAREDSHQDGKIQTQLDYISRGVDDIRIDLKANEKQVVALGERVTRVEESAKQAHKRIDKIEGDGSD